MNPASSTTRWLITGGCGFIGRNLIDFLAHPGRGDVRVLVYDDFSVAGPQQLAEVETLEAVHECAAGEALAWPTRAGVVHVLRGDVRDAAALRAAAADADIIVHLAANTGVAPSVEDPRRDCDINVFGTLNALEAARHGRARAFVFASSGAPLGLAPPPIDETVAPHPASPYGASKLAGEGYCQAYANAFGVHATALRFSNVYGPYSGHKSSVVAAFLNRALDGLPLQVYGDGSQTRDFIYVEDLVNAIWLAANARAAGGEIFQVSTGVETSVNELLALLREAFTRAALPFPPVELKSQRVGDVQQNYANPGKARAQLGWQPGHSLATGVARTLDWFLAKRGTVTG